MCSGFIPLIMAVPKTGLKENLPQFILLLIVNGFVGGMLGLERSILPQIAETEFGIEGNTALLSFIVVFGLVKAITNYFTGSLANRFGRRQLLIAGWVVALPFPFILMYAEHWNWIIAANVLLGINQGMTWSSTVVMKTDLVGEKQRGFAMGLNEFTGYFALSLSAFFSSYMAARYGLRPYPFIIGIVFVFLALGLSIFLIKDTRGHVETEAADSKVSKLKNIFFDTSWRHPILGSVTQAGLINNLNDGMIWGLLPILLWEKGFSIAQIGLISAIYPAVWGIGQILTGGMADRFSKKGLIFWGMFLQGLAIILLIFADGIIHFSSLLVVLGWGTAMVYPTFLSSIGENTHPHDRAKSMGVFRLWRDLGYAIGALITGVIANHFGLPAAVIFIGGLTLFSALIVWLRMKENGKTPNQTEAIKKT